MMQKYVKMIQLFTILLAIVTSLIGVFSMRNGFPYSITSMYGREVILYGIGVYGYMSVMRAGTYIATDIVVLCLSLITIFFLLKRNERVISQWIRTAIFIFIFYYSCSLVFGTPLSTMFMLYVLLFSLSGASLYFSLKESMSLNLEFTIQKHTHKKTAVFLLIASMSSLVWLTLLIPAVLRNDFSTIVDINTTEPTFAIDIAFIFPLFLFTGIGLLQKKRLSYLLTPIVLTFYTLIGILVISQTVVQYVLDGPIELFELITLVLIFIVLSAFAFVINYKFIKQNHHFYSYRGTLCKINKS